MRLEGIPAEYLTPRVWTVTRPFIEKLVARSWGDISVETVREGIERRELQLWHIVDDIDDLHAIWITEIYTEPTGLKVLNWFGCAGEHADHWLPLRHQVEQWARDQGVNAAKITGRKGWERKLPDYRAAHVEYIKVL